MGVASRAPDLSVWRLLLWRRELRLREREVPGPRRSLRRELRSGD